MQIYEAALLIFVIFYSNSCWNHTLTPRQMSRRWHILSKWIECSCFLCFFCPVEETLVCSGWYFAEVLQRLGGWGGTTWRFLRTFPGFLGLLVTNLFVAVLQSDDLDGEINLTSCVNVSDCDVEKNYGLQIQVCIYCTCSLCCTDRWTVRHTHTHLPPFPRQLHVWLLPV